MPNENDIESYWGHRQSPPVETPSSPEINMNGRMIYNILARMLSSPVQEGRSRDLEICNRLIECLIGGEFPDYLTMRAQLEQQKDEEGVRALDNLAYGYLSPNIDTSEIFEFLRRIHERTPTNHIDEVDRQIGDYILEYLRENHTYPRLAIMRGHFSGYSSMSGVLRRIQELVVQVGGLDQRVTRADPSRGFTDEALTQTVLNFRRLALLLSDLQGIVNNIDESESMGSTIGELISWAERQGAAASLPPRWWEDTLVNFEVNYRIRPDRRVWDQDTQDRNAPDRRILAYMDQYLSMEGNLPTHSETSAYFTSQNDGPALARLAEIIGVVQVQTQQGGSLSTENWGGWNNNLELPERRSDEERDYNLRINLRRLALMLDGMIQTYGHLTWPSGDMATFYSHLRELGELINTIGGSCFDPHFEWRADTLRNFRIEFLHRSSPGTFPRPTELYPTERHAFQPPPRQQQRGVVTGVATLVEGEDDAVEGDDRMAEEPNPFLVSDERVR